MDGKAIRLSCRLFFVVLVGLSCQVQSQSSSISLSTSQFTSGSDSIADYPCSFRGNYMLHKQHYDLDSCTACLCDNGTVRCTIEGCPRLQCDEVSVLPGICCPNCIYKMVVISTQILDFTCRHRKNRNKRYCRFSLDISVQTSYTSTDVMGVNLWKLSAWISTNADGNGTKYDLNDNIFSEQYAAKPFKLNHYPPWQWKKLFNNMTLRGGPCDQCRYMCVEFGLADDPRPLEYLPFTFQPVNFETERLVDCVSLSKREGIGCTYKGISFHDKTVIRPGNCTECMCLDGFVNCTKENCDGGTDVPEEYYPSYRPTQSAGIGCAYEGISFHDKTVIRPDNCTECMCLNGTVNCTKEICDVGTDVPEEYYPSHRPTQTDDMTSLYTDETEDEDSTRPTLPTIVIVILSLSISLIFLLVILLLIRRKITTNSETIDYSLVLS